jgi:hypothetical protein
MRSPERWRRIALGFFISGCVAAPAAFLVPGLSPASWVRTSLFIYGLMAIIFGGGTALFRHFDVRAKQALARGENVIARWRVESDAWNDFVALDRRWNEGRDFVPNELSEPVSVPAEGVEVMVGRSAIQIDQSVHRLSGGMPEVTSAELHDLCPGVIELQLYYPGGGHGASGVPRGPTRTALRFPVGKGAWKEAGMVVAHYRGDTPRKADFLHGPGDGGNPEDLSKCYHCGYETYRLMSHCPQCGRGLQSKRWARRYGCMLLVIGLFISAVMTLVLVDFGPKLLHPITGSTGFSGTAGEGKLVLVILGAAEVFGVTALAYGLWQMFTGRRSKWVIYFAVGVVVTVVIIALAL